ncbi:hypothetical protein [Micromonospora sp. KC721]|uniref:hypothetical protein n=1 Tax=Micromonospora sp. KC721 TaxID=2530380 RepID=UPI001404D5D3|nr:hypothetical protein [Micromonospora sp. KC721]
MSQNRTAPADVISTDQDRAAAATPDGHGRNETRTVKALTVQTPGGLGFPRAEQTVRITRTRTIKGKTSREMACLTISLPAGQARPVDLGIWARTEWHIEIVYIACGMSLYAKTRIRPDRQRPRRVRHPA